MADDMFKQAVEAAKSGQRNRAKDLFTRLIRADAKNVDYWLWMSAVVDTEKEQIFCLQNALKIDPNSIQARRGLVVLGALKPEEAALPPVQQLEELDVEIPELETGGGLSGFFSRRRNREVLLIAGLALVGVIIVGVLFVTVLAPNLFRPRRVVVVTSAPTASATLAPTVEGAPTFTPEPCTFPYEPDPAQPLAFYLCLTQVPTTIPVATVTFVQGEFRSLQSAYRDSRWSDAITAGERAIKFSDIADSPVAYFYLAEAYRHTGKFSDAVQNYNLSLSKDRNYAPAYWGRALAEINRGELQAGIDDFGRALNADPTFVPAMLDRGLYYFENSNYPRALADFEAARLAAPGNAEAAARLALAYVESGQPDAALDAAQQAIANDPGLALGYFARGRAEYALGQNEQADRDLSLSYRYVTAMSEVLYAKLWQARAYYAYGLGKTGIGDDAAALPAFTQSISTYDSFNPFAHIARGDVFLRQGQAQQARDDYNTAIRQFEEKDANNPAKLDAYLGNGRAWLALNRPDSAISSFLLVVRRRPDDFEANLGYGICIVRVGESENGTYRDALNSLNAAVTLAQTDDQKARALYWRSQLNRILSRTSDEAADLNALLALSAAPTDILPTAQARLTALGPVATLTPTAGGPTATSTPTVAGTSTESAPAARSATPGTGTPSTTGTPARTATPSATLTP